MTAEPAQKPHLHVVECVECERLRRGLVAMQVDLDNANTDLAVKRRQVTAARNEAAGRLRVDPLYPTAERIWHYWRDKCRPKARTFGDDTAKLVLARLKDPDAVAPTEPAYTPRYICEAILGAAVEPYVDPRGKKHNSLDLICRSPSKLENFHERWERHQAKQEARGC